jgi:hypothetical protein
MLDRSRWLLVYNADPDEFAKRYGIAPFTADCYVCGRPGHQPKGKP